MGCGRGKGGTELTSRRSDFQLICTDLIHKKYPGARRPLESDLLMNSRKCSGRYRPMGLQAALI
jgi:hypothetical protein